MEVCATWSPAARAHPPGGPAPRIGSPGQQRGRQQKVRHARAASAAPDSGPAGFNFISQRKFGTTGSRSLIFDLSVTHHRFGSSSHTQQNELLMHPLVSVTSPMRLCVLLRSARSIMIGNNTLTIRTFLFSTGRPRIASLQLGCNRNKTSRTCFVFAARPSIRL
jgi:hypothetical protein